VRGAKQAKQRGSRQRLNNGYGARVRVHRRRSADPDRRAVELLLAKELVEVSRAAARAYGLLPSRRGSSRISSSASRAPLARKIFQDAHRLGDLAAEWAENGHFLERSGRPKVLPIEGAGASFRTLARKHFGRRRLSEVLDLAARRGVIEQIGPHEVAQRTAWVMLTGDSVLLLARAVLCVHWILKAARRNGRKSANSAALLPERMASARIPVEWAAQFADLMRAQLSNAAEIGNRWLSKRALQARTRRTARRTSLVGVHAYVFRD